jgi:hypothetical protein
MSIDSISPNPIPLVYRVNWMRSKGQNNRWKEELEITQHEMIWVLLWFQNRANVWRTRAKDSNAGRLEAYAHRQAAHWNRRKDIAFTHFRKLNPALSDIFGYEGIHID